MEYRPLKLTVISAEKIKDMNTFSKQDVYVVVSIAGYPASQKKTPVDKDGGTKPKWNFQMEFVVDEPYLTKPGLSLLFQIFAESALRSDKEIGTVTVPVDELFRTNSSSDHKSVEYQVMTEGKPKGTLKFSFNFGEKFTQQAPEAPKHLDHPVAAYPAKNVGEPANAYPPAGYPGAGYAPQYAPPPAAAYGGYPPQPSGYGYQPYGQPSGYGYQQPPPPGYGYPQGPMPGYGGKPQKPKKGMGMGAGLGLGLGAGLLGGLLVGEMADGIGDEAAYADGYDDAMGDMGGGDFDF